MKILDTLGLISMLLAMGCGSGPSGEEGKNKQKMDQRTAIRMKQYKIEGKKLYQVHCANCHQKNGEGLARLYPPLVGSDYLLADLPRAACIVKYGQDGPITVNGKSYDQMMPGVESLAPLEVAEILTYISNSWGNMGGISSTRDVTKWLKDCEK